MKFIIPIVVGAIIGYVTNWLAIKMLFRPYNKKKFLGVDIPFTPGVIPKEKSRIAKSVGETIGEHLLSPEIVASALSGEKAKDQIEAWFKDNINRLKEYDRSIKDTVISLAGNNYDKIYCSVVRGITDFICSKLKEQRLRTILTCRLKDMVFSSRYEDFFQNIKEKAGVFLYELSVSHELKDDLKNTLDRKINEFECNESSLDQIIPESVRNAINQYIIEHHEEILKAIKEMIENPVVRIRLKVYIAELVAQNTNKFLAMFLSPEAIGEKVFEALEKYMNNPDNSKKIVFIIITALDKLMETRVSSIVSGVSPEVRQQSIAHILQVILEQMSDKERQSRILDMFEEKLKASDGYVKESLFNFISGRIDTFLDSPELSVQVSFVVEYIVEGFSHKPVAYIVKGMDDRIIETISDLFNDIFGRFVKNRLPYFIQLLNIPKIVEDRINSFDVAFTEEIILEIASKELKAITWLGALLGGIMGIVSLLMQFF